MTPGGERARSAELVVDASIVAVVEHRRAPQAGEPARARAWDDVAPLAALPGAVLERNVPDRPPRVPVTRSLAR